VSRTNLDHSSDWIVLNWSLDTLAILARTDVHLIAPLREYLGRFEHSTYRSLVKRCRDLLDEFGAGDATA